MSEEVPLIGGRITQGVVKKGNHVLRPLCSNSTLVHDVLRWLDNKSVELSPKFIGVTDDNREIISFLEGVSPNNIGWFCEDQIYQAGKIIKCLHDNLSDFPGCSIGQTVCHNDLSPCNFMFLDNLPYAVFDWDAAKIDDPINDVAYAVWLWLDIGYEGPYEYCNEINTPSNIGKKAKILLDAYELENNKRNILIPKIYEQMQRVSSSSKLDNRKETYKWVHNCELWLRKYEDEIFLHFK
jgi:hypothetical protein